MAIRHGMGKPGAAIRLIGLVVLSLLMMGDAFADPVAKVVKLTGEVTLTHNGSDRAVTVDTALNVGDVVKTGARARLRLKFIDGSILSFAEQTTISIEQFDYNSGSQSRNVILNIAGGIINAAATKSASGDFNYRVHHGDVYSAVRGTEWFADT